MRTGGVGFFMDRSAELILRVRHIATVHASIAEVVMCLPIPAIQAESSLERSHRARWKITLRIQGSQCVERAGGWVIANNFQKSSDLLRTLSLVLASSW